MLQHLAGSIFGFAKSMAEGEPASGKQGRGQAFNLEHGGAFWVLVCLLLVASFRLYSSRYIPTLNSDDALNVLMTRDYALPHDLYCWGQDRGGTLIPLMGQLFYRVLHVPPIWSVSLGNYLLVVFGGIGIARLFKHRASQLMFAFIWLLPPWWFVDALRFPFGVQYCLVGIALWIIADLPLGKERPFRVQDHVRMFFFTLVSILAVWVSDLAGLTVVAAAVAWLLWRQRKGNRLLPRKEVLAWCIGGLFAGIAFLGYAKFHAPSVTGSYPKINSPGELVGSLSTFIGSVADLLLFRTGDPFMSVYSVLALLSLLVVGGRRVAKAARNTHSGFVSFFAIDATLVLLAVWASRWAALNGLSRRYFIGVYLSVSVLVLLWNELSRSATGKFRPAAVLLWATVLAGAASGPLQMKFIWPGTLEPRVDVAAEFLRLGRIGLIGEYTNAFVACTPDPDRIAAIPHDKDDVKNFDLVPPVFDGRDLYVIGDMWLDNFPDTLWQFGHKLARTGEPFNIAGCLVNQYVEVHPTH